MAPVLWMLAGAGALLALSVLVGMAMDERIRQDIAAALLGAVALPVMVPVTMFVRVFERLDIGVRPMSNRALARFADQRQHEDVDRHAWMFSLRGRGLIVVRKRPRPEWSRPARDRDGGDRG